MMYRYFLILLLAFTSCEYYCGINLSSRLPLTVKLEDNDAKIKRLTVYKKTQKNNLLIIEIEHYKERATGFINFDSLSSNSSNYMVTSGVLDTLKFEPNKDYSIYIKTDKGYAGGEFYVDKDGNIITLPPYGE